MTNVIDVLAKVTALALATLLVIPAQAFAESATDGLPDSQPKALHIDILEGEGALNNIQARTAREPIVQVTDENHKPVSGALVIFLIHDGSDGSGATFAPANVKTLQVTTDAEGKARARGFRPNQHTGSYTIAVSAAVAGLIAYLDIHETNRANAPPAGEPHAKLGRIFTIGIILLAGAALGYGAASSGSGSGTTITTGPGGVGPPGAVSHAGHAGVRFTFGKQ